MIQKKYPQPRRNLLGNIIKSIYTDWLIYSKLI